MTFLRMLGFILVAVGIFLLVDQGITYTHRKEILHVGSIRASENQRNNVPPLLGGAILAGGIGLLAFSIGKRD